MSDIEHPKERAPEAPQISTLLICIWLGLAVIFLLVRKYSWQGIYFSVDVGNLDLFFYTLSEATAALVAWLALQRVIRHGFKVLQVGEWIAGALFVTYQQWQIVFIFSALTSLQEQIHPAVFYVDDFLSFMRPMSMLVKTAILIFAATRINSRMWRVCLSFLAIDSLLVLSALSLGTSSDDGWFGGNDVGSEAIDWLWNVTRASVAAAACLTAMAIVHDWAKGRQYNWLHWAGVAALLLAYAYCALDELAIYWAVSVPEFY